MADPLERIADSVDRIARLMAGLLLKDLDGAEQNRKIARLKVCGLGNVEIAEMLGTTPGSVKVAAHHLKQRKTGKRSRRAKKG